MLVLSELGTAGAERFARWQKSVLVDLSGAADAGSLAEGLDGRLTSLDRLAADVPEAMTVVRARAEEIGLMPEPVARVLASYPFRPAEWFVDREMEPPGQAEIDRLAEALLAVLRDSHREAVIKCLPIWSAVQAGTFRTSSETVELLQSYPNDPATRSMADSVVRSMWGAHRGLRLSENENHLADAMKWAKVFWGMNSMSTRCVRSSTRETGGDDLEGTGLGGALDEQPASEVLVPGNVPEDGAHLRQLSMDLLSSYVEALETSPSRLYDPERQEVHSGLVSRVGRDVVAVLGAPDLWCMEHGAHVIRALVEVRIYIQWMAQQDPSIYRVFQEYGAGKAKLYARILDALPDDARRPDFEEALRDLERLSHNDQVLDHRTVDTRDSFANGKSIRAMAEECGLLDLYRQTYSMASGVSHSEWWSVETHAMERCLNILHRGHLIPSLSLNAGGNVEFARSWVDQLYGLIRISLQILGTDDDAVNSAFAWLEAEDESETEAEPATTTGR